ncbi:MAG: hypothetical protein IMW94_02140 [Thermoanaerobacter sp.]|nr:hypothetical protein [Thermoanaerobacter sp.]
MGEAKTVKLKDFLYKDIARLDSFYAQLFQGNLIGVQKSSSLITTRRYGLGASLPTIAKADHTGEKGTTESISWQINPEDQKIIDILTILDVPLYQQPLEQAQNGQLILIEGYITLRNFQTIKNALPPLLDHIPFEKAQNKKNLKKEKDMVIKSFKIIPMGLEIEVFTSHKESLIGTIKPGYLCENPDDLLRLYGNYLPGKWQVFGIFSRHNDFEASPSPSEMRKSIDEFGMLIKELFSPPEQIYSITPILIFREVAIEPE